MLTGSVNNSKESINVWKKKEERRSEERGNEPG